MKKILSLVLVLSLVLGSMSMAFAAAPSFSDVENEDVLKAVLRLNAFGIVDGYNDGSYKPENNITRAEFSKLLVTALGLENAAKAASGISHFSDVTGNEWFAGAVNVAAGQGIVKGYADGTYRPDAEVKYSEAVTMLVRALGYKDEFLPGKWPGNFIAQAADAGITDDVTFQPDGIANRGAVALMLNNALDAQMVKVTSYNKDIFNADSDAIHYGLVDATLLSDKLGIDKYESIELTETPKVDSGLDADQVGFRETDDSEMNGVDVDDIPSKFDVKDVELLDKLETHLGESLNVYVDDDEVLFFETSDNAYTVKWGTVDAEDVASDEMTVIFVDGDDKDYDYDEDEIVIYVDNEETDADELKGELFGKFVIADNGDIALADLHDWNDEAIIVTESSEDEFEFFEITGSKDNFEADDFDKVVVMDTAGNLMSLADLEKDDVVYINEAELAESGDDVAYVVVLETAAVVEEAKSYDINDDDKESEFRTTEATYDVMKDGTVSADEDDEFVEFVNAGDELETITGEGAKVQILFNIVGDIRHIRSDVEVSSTDLYGVVLGTDEDNFDDDEIQVKVLTSTEDKVVYDIDFDDDEFLNVATPNDTEGDLLDNLDKGDIIKYTLNSDGEIDSLIVVNNNTGEMDANTGNKDTVITSGTLDEDIDEDSIEFDFGKAHKGDEDDFTVASDVIVFDITDTASDMAVVDFDKVVGNGSGEKILVVANDDEEVELIVLDNNVASDDEYIGYILDTRQYDGTHYFEMAIYGEDEVKEYEVDESNIEVDKIAEESIVVFEIKSDDTIEIKDLTDPAGKKSGKTYGSDDYDFVIGQVVDIDGTWLEIDTKDADNNKVKLYSDTLMYEDDSDDADVDQYDFVLVVADGTKARVVKRFDIDYEDFDADGDVEEEFIAIFGGDISELEFGEGDTPEGGDVVVDGTVAYINDVNGDKITSATVAAGADLKLDAMFANGSDKNITLELTGSDTAKYWVVDNSDGSLEVAIDDLQGAAADVSVLKGKTVQLGGTITFNTATAGDYTLLVEIVDGTKTYTTELSITVTASTADATAAKTVVDEIAALGSTPTKSAVNTAKGHYDGLSANAKELVTNYATLKAFVDDIAAGAVVEGMSLDTNKEVKDARAAYDDLGALGKAEVTVSNITAAETALANAKTALANKIAEAKPVYTAEKETLDNLTPVEVAGITAAEATEPAAYSAKVSALGTEIATAEGFDAEGDDETATTIGNKTSALNTDLTTVTGAKAAFDTLVDGVRP